jgi:hypothetical protein
MLVAYVYCLTHSHRVPSPGRTPDLDEARTERVQVRLSEHERAAFDRASALAGLSIGEWLRITGLTAAGAGELLAQLRRVAPSLSERVDIERRRRVMEARHGTLTPIWTHGPHAHCTVEQLVSEPIVYEAALVMHVLPRELPYGGDEAWPPKKGAPAIMVSELRDRGPRDLYEEVKARREAVIPALLPKNLGGSVRRAHAYEGGYQMDAAIATYAINDREPTKPHAWAKLTRSGRIETTLELRVEGREKEIDLHPFVDLASILGPQLRLIDELGATFPIAVGLSLYGVKGKRLRGPALEDPQPDMYPLGRAVIDDEVFLPIVEVANADADARAVLQRPLDALWQACGLRECHVARQLA